MGEWEQLSSSVRDKRKTTQELVTDALRQAILNGYFGDGEPIETTELANKFGVSRMPIRIALQQLEKEGLVLLPPHKKAVAVKLSPDEVRKISAIRYELEALAIRESSSRITSSHIEKAEKLISKMDQCQSSKEFVRLNMEFHNIIYQPCQNEPLINIITQYRNNVERYLHIYLKDMESIRMANEDHKQILQSLKDHNIMEAEKQIRKHLMHTCETIAELLEQTKV